MEKYHDKVARQKDRGGGTELATAEEPDRKKKDRATEMESKDTYCYRPALQRVMGQMDNTTGIDRLPICELIRIRMIAFAKVTG